MIYMDVEPEFKQVLEFNGLNDFESLWHAPGELVEQGNVKQKSGHSHVKRLHLKTHSGALICVYMKQQSNYATTFSRLLGRSRSICRREYDNIRVWEEHDLPALKGVYCAEQQQPSLRGILITVALKGYEPLDDFLRHASAEKRRNMIVASASLIRRIHQAGWVHRCLFPKHVFVSDFYPELPAQMIDLEKARKAWFGIHDFTRDLTSFERRMAWQNEEERKLFLDTYFGGADMTMRRRLFMHLIGRRMTQKKRIQ